MQANALSKSQTPRLKYIHRVTDLPSSQIINSVDKILRNPNLIQKGYSLQATSIHKM